MNMFSFSFEILWFLLIIILLFYCLVPLVASICTSVIKILLFLILFSLLYYLYSWFHLNKIFSEDFNFAIFLEDKTYIDVHKLIITNPLNPFNYYYDNYANFYLNHINSYYYEFKNIYYNYYGEIDNV